MSLTEKIVYMDEKKALLLAMIIVAWAFGGHLIIEKGNIEAFILNSVVVVIAFLPHELAHRYYARKYGCYSRFILDPLGAAITLMSGFIPFIRIIIPGYVFISMPYYDSTYTKKIMGVVSAAGPVVNIVMAIISFIILNTMYQYLSVTLFLFLLFMTGINAWIAFFNLLPIPPLDGSKIIKWNPVTWGVLFAISITLMFISGF
ncbi:site-2 protease family protein [Desulfurococcaceae archaeon MEX13E-LK6-19]|nr:site-2 protease family protein [Desulfurococcaceae archaeon MEX13E-LK6-19]